MIELLISVLILCIVFSLIWWILSVLPLPEPFGQIARVVLMVIFAIILIYALLGLLGHPLGLRLR